MKKIIASTKYQVSSIKKKCSLLCTLYFILCSFSSFSQAGQWVWIHGSNTSGNTGNHGTKGVPGATVEPPSLYEACEWTDKNGNYWLYGGQDANASFHNDLFKYDPVADEWEWVSGTNATGDPGVYGTQGVASPTNRPPSRGWAPASWTDTAGHLWMFGGNNGADYNDLWMYDIGSNEWTWMKGPNTGSGTGTYGTQGIPSVLNVPASRHEGSAAWTDNSGDLWLFGGYIFAGAYNDTWRFNIASNTWTWMKGGSTTGQAGTYGIKGVEAAANTPSARLAYCRWKDNSGMLWFFGGWEWGTGKLRSDLWRFNPVTHNWAWMNGDTLGNSTGFYGTKCVSSASNQPSGRYEDRAAWTDNNGNLWMFGGATSGLSNLNNDLWMYCITKNEWTWVSGDSTFNQLGNYGVKDVPSATNKPSGKAGALAWTDNKGDLYLFGGTGSSGVTPFNDLWKYPINPACGSCVSVLPPVADFQASDSSICTNDCISFTNLSTNATSYQWTFAGAFPPSDTSANPQSVCYLTAGTFDVTLVATNSGGNDTLKATLLINVANSPPTPVITQTGSTLYCSTDPSYTSYQWYDSTSIIPGATDTFLVITHGGNYNVQVSNENGCKIAVGITVILGLKDYAESNSISLSPNPASSKLQLTIGNRQNEKGNARINIYNILGQVCQQSQISNLKSQIELDVSSLASGIYFIQVVDGMNKWVGKFVKE